MVMRWGMSDEVGVVCHSDQSSPEQRALIDREVKKILTLSYARATKLLQDNRKDLELIAKALLDHETLSGDEIANLLAGQSIKNPVKEKTELLK